MSKINICRLCLCKIEDTLDLESNTTTDEHLLEQINVIFGIELNFDTSLPQIVCSCCTDRVKSFYDFYRVVLDNQENLKILIFDDETFEEEEPNVEVFAQEISVKTEQQSNVCKVRQKPTWDVERISKFIAFRCDECPSEQLPDFIEWRNHLKICHDTDNPSYVCCEIKLTTEKSFLTHINKFHDLTKKRRFSCAICMRKFNHKAQIEKHMRVHLRHVPDGYQCKKCPETFMLVTHWRTHQLLHMPNASDNDILFPCKKCPEEFATIKLLQAHLRNQHKQKFLCDLCAEVFYMKFALSEHIRKTHMPNPRAYKCPQCEVAFLNKGNLRNHIKLLHTKKGVYPCDKCDKVLVTERQLKNHTQYTHQLDRNFPCKYCQKAFKRPCDLEDHESVHTGISRHSCPKCDRMFNSKSNMQSHAKRCKGNDF